MQFSRQEAIALSGLSSHQISYLDSQGIICPTKMGKAGTKRPTCLYTWKQVLALRAYFKIREECSLQALREAFNFLNDYHPEDLVQDKRLICASNKIYWIDDTKEEMGSIILEIIGSNKAQTILPISFTISNLIEEIKHNGKNNIVDFERRFQEATNQNRETVNAA